MRRRQKATPRQPEMSNPVIVFGRKLPKFLVDLGFIEIGSVHLGYGIWIIRAEAKAKQ
jgi:hypothetical protein